MAKPKKDADEAKYFECIARSILFWGDDLTLEKLLAIVVWCDCLYLEHSEPLEVRYEFCRAAYRLATGLPLERVAITDSSVFRYIPPIST